MDRNTVKQFYECNKCKAQFYYPSHLLMHNCIINGTKSDDNKEQEDNNEPIVKTESATPDIPPPEDPSQRPQRPYKCNVCQKGFKLSHHLKVHKLIHTGERPFKCEVCERAFTQSNDLKRHVRIHTGEKPYKCPVCKKQFRLLNDLRVHSLVHTGERPFECDTCSMAFTNHQNLRRHKLTHINFSQ